MRRSIRFESEKREKVVGGLLRENEKGRSRGKRGGGGVVKEM
jgi:hypothetical protein